MNDELKKLLKLIEENPNLEVKFAVDSDLANDEFSYTLADIRNIEKEFLYIDDEKVFIGKDEILDYFRDEDEFNLSILDNQFEIFIKDKYSKLIKEEKIKETIIVYIGY